MGVGRRGLDIKGIDGSGKEVGGMEVGKGGERIDGVGLRDEMVTLS